MKLLQFAVVFLALGMQPAAADESGSQPNVQRIEFFEKQVRPILAEHCFECHSGDAEKLQAGLYTDSRQSLLIGGDSGPAIVPGKPDESLLLSAVRYEDFEMPPRGRLPAEDVQVLERWIAEGAWWPEDESASAHVKIRFDWQQRQQQHWAWQPLGRPQPPAVEHRDWPDNEIDHFILSKWEQAEIEPAGLATREQLLRRLYYDLTGLPPSTEQTRAFLNNGSSMSYAELVDHLLDSPRFGEKWTRHWLDLVRYAETCGHEFDYPIQHAYRYRDYLIQALNQDVPYDQLVLEHLAGDLLDSPRRNDVSGVNESIIGTGFWFLGEAIHSPTDVRGDEADRIDNQIDVFGKAFLGLTIACARCHDHKFDAISTADYYALAGYLQSSRRQEALLDPHGRVAEKVPPMRHLRRQGQAHLRAALASMTLPPAADLVRWRRAMPSVPSKAQSASDATGSQSAEQAKWTAAWSDPAIDSASHPLYAWKQLTASSTVPFTARKQALSSVLTTQQEAAQSARRDIRIFADFAGPDFSPWFVTGLAFGDQPTRSGDWSITPEGSYLQTSALAHSGQSGRNLQGVLRSPTFTLNHRQIHYRINARNAQIRLIIDGYVMGVFAPLLFADATLNDVNTNGKFEWVTQQRDLEHYQGHQAHLEIIDHGDGYAIVDQIYMSNGNPPPATPHALNLQFANDPTIRSIDDLAAAYVGRLREAAQRLSIGTGDDTDVELANWLIKWDVAPIRVEAWRALRERATSMDASIPPPVRVVALADGTSEDARIHIRGSHRNLGDVVPRRFLLALAGLSQPPSESGSGRLALALRTIDSPLVPRVVVNRLWHHLMGRGIVATVDNFGVMGEPPSHPDLLEWLATDHIDHGWSLKSTIRKIVMSRTYRLASARRATLEQIDPTNRLWHRALVRRLNAESIRDSLLMVSGRLESQMGGPSVPVYLTRQMTGRGRPSSGPLDGDGRRSLYIRVQRNFLSPMMLAFDMPSPFSAVGRRSRSNVPAQSLILMNNPFVWQQAEVWARRLIHQTSPADDRISQAYLQAFARPPSAAQRRQVKAFIQQQAAARQQSQDSVAVWTDVCHALWNTKEFIYLY